MKKTLLAALAGAALAATPALAQFEGEIDMKMTVQGGATGNGRVLVSKTGARTELDLQAQRMPLKMTTIMKFATPDTMYLVNDSQKTYAELDLKKLREQAGSMEGKKAKEPWAVKKLGRETVNGYSCEHVLASKGTTEIETWTTKDIAGLSYETMRGLMRRGPQGDEGLFAALRDAGADGFSVKSVVRDKATANVQTTMELTKVEKKSIPAALFEIPPGYTKQEGMMGAAGVMSPEAQEQMRKAMESLTPEQRRQMEEMMKSRQQQQQQQVK